MFMTTPTGRGFQLAKNASTIVLAQRQKRTQYDGVTDPNIFLAGRCQPYRQPHIPRHPHQGE